MQRPWNAWVILLVSCFLSLTIADRKLSGQTTLADLAERQSWDDLIERLGSKTSEIDFAQSDGMTALHWAVDHQRADIVKKLLDAGSNPSLGTRYSITPLMIACRQGNSQVAELLVAAGAKVDSRALGDETPLMMSSRQGNASIVELLLSKGAEVDATDRKGQTALMWAAAAGNTNCVKVLIDSGADMQKELRSGFTPFYFAARSGHIDATEYFVKRGMDVNRPMNVQTTGGRFARNQSSALIIAVESGHFELALRLVELGADPNDQRCGFAPLHVLSWVRKPKSGDGFDGDPPPRGSGKVSSLAFVRRLVSMGADVNLALANGKPGGKAQLNMRGATPLLLASKTADLPLMKLYVELGADIHANNADGCTPFLATSGVGTVAVDEEPGTEPEVLEALRYLVSLGAVIDSVDANGDTAMHGAAYRAFPQEIQYLRDLGLHSTVWNHPNKFGWSPFDISDGKRPGSVKPNPTVRAALTNAL
jgi:ankyrin repeat protein